MPPLSVPTGLTIRRAQPHDLPDILALLEAGELYTSSVTLAGNVTYLLGEWLGESCPIAVVGMEHGEGATLLRSFTVLPRYRGRGVAGIMLAAAYAVMRERGDSMAFLFSADEGEFWRHQGYSAISSEELARRLPQTSQVQSAQKDGWLAEALAWSRPL